jgi:hypothetical protein
MVVHSAHQHRPSSHKAVIRPAGALNHICTR